MNFILRRKLKIYTKETIKFLKITLIAFGFIIAIALIKYKPIYKVSISGKVIGYVTDKKSLQENIKVNVEEYSAKNVNTATLENGPELELELINKTQETNESEIIIALQKELKITYKYYQIEVSGKILESVDTLEEAEELKAQLQQENKIDNINIIEQITENNEEVQTKSVEVAKGMILTEITEQQQKEEEGKSLVTINEIKIANLPVTGTITSRFGERSSIRSSTHTGLDIAAKTGTPINVVADGTIISATYTGSYGNLVKVDHGNGVETWYGHTSKMYVSKGQKVSAGELIAAVGSTGNSTGAHLHFEIRINGNIVNPQNYLYK